VQIGCHGLVWTGAYDADGIRTAVRKTREAGFDLIEFPLMDPFTFDVSTAKDALQEHGIVATGSLGLNERTDISSEDGAVVRAGEDLLGRAVEVLAELGSNHLCGIIYSAMRKYMEPATEKGIANSQAVIGRIAEKAEQVGVKLSLEVTNRYESNVLNTARQAREFASAVGHGNVSVHVDTYHMNIEETDMFSPILDTADLLGYVHVGESHRGYLGTGNVDFDSFFKALGRVGYDGPIVFESFSSAVVAPDLSRMLGIWRNLWTDNVELGAHASAFIRDKLVAVASIKHH
jgi:D-psicose/D-tagatose/L-ribulose 3-epimerase